jgi:hypothetical protein
MSLLFLTVVVVLLAVAGIYFVLRLAWHIGGSTWVIWRQSRELAETVRRDLASLTTEQIRARVLSDSYFDSEIRAYPQVASFLARLANGEERTLRREYSKNQLYKQFVNAERAAGRRGRPEAVDAIYIIDRQLTELARRSSPAV